MNTCEVFIALISLTGSILFCQFMFEIWDEKYKRRKRDNWDKFDNF